MEDNENTIHIIKKHGEVMLHDGRKYHKKKTYKNGNVLWRCTNWRKLKCGGYVTVGVSNCCILDMIDMIHECS